MDLKDIAIYGLRDKRHAHFSEYYFMHLQQGMS